MDLFKFLTSMVIMMVMSSDVTMHKSMKVICINKVF